MADGFVVEIKYAGEKLNRVASLKTPSAEFATLKKDLAHLRVHCPSQKNVCRVKGSFFLHWPTAGTNPCVNGVPDSLHTRWFKLCSDDPEAHALRSFLSIVTVPHPAHFIRESIIVIQEGRLICSTPRTRQASLAVPPGTLANGVVQHPSHVPVPTFSTSARPQLPPRPKFPFATQKVKHGPGFTTPLSGVEGSFNQTVSRQQPDTPEVQSTIPVCPTNTQFQSTNLSAPLTGSSFTLVKPELPSPTIPSSDSMFDRPHPPPKRRFSNIEDPYNQKVSRQKLDTPGVQATLPVRPNNAQPKSTNVPTTPTELSFFSAKYRPPSPLAKLPVAPPIVHRPQQPQPERRLSGLEASFSQTMTRQQPDTPVLQKTTPYRSSTQPTNVSTTSTGSSLTSARPQLPPPPRVQANAKPPYPNRRPSDVESPSNQKAIPQKQDTSAIQAATPVHPSNTQPRSTNVSTTPTGSPPTCVKLQLPPPRVRVNTKPQSPHLNRQLSGVEDEIVTTQTTTPSNTQPQQVNLSISTPAVTKSAFQPARDDGRPSTYAVTPTQLRSPLDVLTTPASPPREPGEITPQKPPPPPPPIHIPPRVSGPSSAISTSSTNDDTQVPRRRDRDVSRLMRELTETRDRLTAMQAREQFILDDLEKLGAHPAKSNVDRVSRDDVLRLEAELKAERTKRARAEQALSEVERECRAPFVVPALFQAFLSISELSN